MRDERPEGAARLMYTALTEDEHCVGSVTAGIRALRAGQRPTRAMDYDQALVEFSCDNVAGRALIIFGNYARPRAARGAAA